MSWRRNVPTHCPQTVADDKGWSPIKAVSVSSRGFDWNELHLSEANWNTATSISSECFEWSHCSSWFFGEFVPKRLVNILAFTCLINSLSDPVRVILITDYFKTLAQSVICRWPENAFESKLGADLTTKPGTPSSPSPLRPQCSPAFIRAGQIAI